MTDDWRTITRGKLPAEFTPETLRSLPISVLRRLGNPRNGVLTPRSR